jgi:hypothetical protein
MQIIALPNYIGDAIDEKINTYTASRPSAECDREEMRQAMIKAFAEYGVIADIAPPERNRVLHER